MSLKIRNWSEYNKALVNRGSINLWVDEEVIASWYAPTVKGKNGHPQKYSDQALTAVLSLGCLLNRPLRFLEGFAASLLKILAPGLECPDYTTLCRRRKTLKPGLARRPQLKPGEGLIILVDSTGLKVYGEGEWKVRQYGVSKRRTWRKLHIAIDGDTHEIQAAGLSDKDLSDGEALPDLLDAIKAPIASVGGDGAYDPKPCRTAIQKHQAKAIIPPRKDAVVHKKDPILKERNEAVEFIGQHGAKAWKISSGYHRRSLVETAMYRLKQLFSPKLSTRCNESQLAEIALRCRALNIMTRLGMPSY
jgi:hypothetical protein